ncbi:MAG: hypothetical protein EBS53_15395, partial [Bacteroidetes bacterium]|nr:hypothetical protein [Bacteroidota bacterium]
RLNGAIISGATNPSYVASTAGAYTVTLTDNTNCSFTSAPANVFVNPLPSLSISAVGNTTVCQGSSVSLNSTTGAVNPSYQWNLNGTGILGATSSTFNAATSGTYSLTITDANGCRATSNNITVTIRELPIATITGNSAICQGGNTVLSVNTGTGRTYQWKRNNVNIIGATTANYTVITAGTYTVNVTSNGCTATSNAITVTVNNLPTVTVSTVGPTTFCPGGSVTLNANTDPSNSIQWRKNGNNIIGATSASFTATDSGNYTARVTNPAGCSVTSTSTLVSLRSTASSTVNAFICQGQSYNFGNQALTSAGTYTQTLPANNGCDSVITLNLQVRPNSSHAISASICQGQTYIFGTQSLTTSGTYTRNIPSTNGCDSIITLELQVKPNSSSSIQASICQGRTYAFGNQILTAAGTYTRTIMANNGCDSIITLLLQVRPNATTALSASICQGQTYTFGSQNLTTAGTYTQILTSSNGCDSTVTLTLSVTPNINNLSIQANGATTYCEGSSVTLTATASGNIAGVSYQWNLNGAAIAGATSNNLVVTNASGAYTVTATNSFGCSLTSPATQVTITSAPQASIT